MDETFQVVPEAFRVVASEVHGPSDFAPDLIFELADVKWDASLLLFHVVDCQWLLFCWGQL